MSIIGDIHEEYEEKLKERITVLEAENERLRAVAEAARRFHAEHSLIVSGVGSTRRRISYECPTCGQAWFGGEPEQHDNDCEYVALRDAFASLPPVAT